jgi:hypothetical protein
VGGSIRFGLVGRVRGRTPLLLLMPSYDYQGEKKEGEWDDSHT